jgi:hypothetical protein
MKTLALIFLTLVANTTSIAATIGSVYLAYHDIKGWGWFLFVAVITNTTPRLKDIKQKKNNEDNTNLILG